MAFIREKKVGKHRYFYLVRNKRVDGKVRQETLAYLGPWSSVKAAIEGFTQEADRHRLDAQRCNPGRMYQAELPNGKTFCGFWRKAEDYLRSAELAEQRADRLKRFM